MIPKKLHQIGRTKGNVEPRLLSWEERRLAYIAKTLMPSWEYYIWPDGPLDEVVKSTVPKLFGIYQSLAPRVAQIDIARCLILYEHGGMYFDTDYRFFREPDAGFREHDLILGIESFDGPELDKFGNAIIASAPKLQIWMDFVEDALLRYAEKGNLSTKPDENKVMDIAGPDALTRFVQGRSIAGLKVYPSAALYPKFNRLKTSAKRNADTIGVHLCWGSWRNKPLPQKVKNRARRLLSAI
jgi:mannosyltransferase OCH1-like enzyme